MGCNKFGPKLSTGRLHIENAELYSFSFLASGCISAHVSGHEPPSLQLCKKYAVVRAYYIWRGWADGRECLATAVNSGAEILVEQAHKTSAETPATHWIKGHVFDQMSEILDT